MNFGSPFLDFCTRFNIMRLFLFWIYVYILLTPLGAQTTGGSPYLFADFQNCLIVYKDGRQFTAPVNFDLVKRHYVFKDPEQQVKEFVDPELIAVLRIGPRSFVIDGSSAVEVMQAEPEFRVIYTGDTRQAPKDISYGGTTQTASVDSYSGLSANGLSSGQLLDNKVVRGVQKTYEVRIGKRMKRFYHAKSLVKALPKAKRAAMEQRLEQQPLDFDNPNEVFRFCQEFVF